MTKKRNQLRDQYYKVLANGRGRIADDRFPIVLECAAIGCMYVDGGYLDQPTWFTERYKIKLEIEAEHERRSAKSSK